MLMGPKSKTTSEILCNIHYTLRDVYINACNVGTWSENDLQVAQSWTLYCEKVYKNSIGKPFEVDLNNYIEELVSRIDGCCVPNADLKFLKFASKALFFLLLQNTKISFDIYAQVLEQYALYGSSTSDLEMPLYIVKGTSSLLEVLGLGNSCIFSYEQWILFGAGLLLQNLFRRTAEETDSTKCEINLRSNLNILRRNDTRLFFLLTSAKERKLSLSKSIYQKLQNYIIHWSVEEMIKAQKQRAAHSFLDLLIKLPPRLLFTISMKNEGFFVEYLKTLIISGQKFEPRLFNHGFCWKSCENVNFLKLVDHFHYLINNDSNLAVSTNKVFEQLRKSPGCSLWEDIHNECLIRNESFSKIERQCLLLHR